jgi:hypothetical protein
VKRLCSLLVINAVVAATLLPADALAQRTGTRMGRNAVKADAEAVSALIAACMVKRRGAIVDRILATLPGSNEEDRLMLANEGAFGICMSDDKLVADGRTLYFDPQGLRLHLGVAAARARLAASTGSEAVANPGTPWFAAPLAEVKADERAEIDQGMLALLEMGDCLLTREKTGAISLVQSDSNTPDQGKAMRKLVPHLSSCLSSGQEIEITPDVVRFAIAEPLYHRLSPQKEPV